MSESSPQFPANVVIYLRHEIERYSKYRVQSETLQPYFGNEWYYKQQYESKKRMVEEAMQGILADIIAITRRHFPTIEVDPNNTVTLSNILRALPDPEYVIVKKVLHGGA